MKKTKILAFILVIVLIAASVVTLYSCEKPDPNTLGKGKTTFKLEVIDDKGVTTTYTIKTDEKTVGAALLKLDLISGDETEYGLYVKTVTGITADWDADQGWWGFYIGNDMAATGIDATDITAGAVYKLKYEIGFGF